MKNCCTFLPQLFALLLTAATPVLAQTPEPRLHGPLRQQARILLPGSAPPAALRTKVLGAIPQNLPIHGITLVFRRSAAQQTDLEQLMEAQQNPASPDFHHWLTPEAFGRRFGVADSDLETTETWLRQQGFTVTGFSHARDRITFSGTAAEVQAAFATTLRQIEVDGERHIAPDSSLSLPSDLAAITLSITHLSDLRPHPMARLAPRPAYTTGSTSRHFLTPPDLAVMYDFPGASNAVYPGEGQSIAVVGQSYVDVSINSVLFQFLTTVNPQGHQIIPVLIPGTGVQAVSPGDAAESEIDLEYASGPLALANTFLVYVGSDPSYNVFDSLAFAIDQNLAPVVSISYGVCEALVSPAELAQGNALFQQATLQGQTIVASAGDSGPTGCARFTSLSTADRGALAVTYPADSPYVTAVGGTEMSPGTFSPGVSPFWAGPIFTTIDSVQSLLSYVPEIAWNEDSSARGLFAGGGGSSSAFDRPSWQNSLPGIPAGSKRIVPDISLQASASNPGFLFCSDDVSFVGSLQNTDCLIGAAPLPNYLFAGGTSFAAPTFAAMVALINQKTLSLGQGNINPLLYQLAADPEIATSVFHDITSGTTACLPTIPGCSTPGQSGFAATPGYDQATGLGSLDLSHLIAALPAPDPALQPTTVDYVQPFNSIVNPGDSDSIYINVRSASLQPGVASPPSGSVSIAVDGTVVDSNLAFSTTSTLDESSSATYILTAPSTPGSHVVVVTYPGDATHSPATSATSVLVGQVTATGSVSLSVANVSLPANGNTSTAVTAAPTGGYNGRLLWSFSLTSNTGAALTACYQIPDLLVIGPSATTLSLGAGTACSAIGAADRSTFRSVHAAATNSPAPWRSAPIAAASLLFLWFLPAPRRRRITPVLCLILLPAALAVVGCGSGSNSGSGGGGGGGTTPVVNTYTGTLTGRDSVNGSITTSANFTITVP